jgi:hypothetical protein
MMMGCELLDLQAVVFCALGSLTCQETVPNPSRVLSFPAKFVALRVLELSTVRSLGRNGQVALYRFNGV